VVRREPGQSPPSARQVAYQALTAVARESVFLRGALDELLRDSRLPAADRAFATELAGGTVRRQGTLDRVLKAHVSRDRRMIEPELWTLMRLGAYQLLFLDTPAHAAVHETVELCRHIGKRRWVPFVNGVLRSLAREPTGEPAAEPGPDTVPIVRCCGLRDEPISVEYRRVRGLQLPDIGTSSAESLGAAFGMPAWLVARWLERMSVDDVRGWCAWFATPGRMSLRVNRLRTDREALLGLLAGAGVSAGAGILPECIRLERATHPLGLPGFADGLFSVQDESAMHAARLLDPRPGDRVLDLCAAPGGKTTHLAELMQNQGVIVALDADAERLALISPECERLGVTIVEPCMVSRRPEELPEGMFDRILLDVPCSNTGVLGKRVEARWRIKAAGIAELADLQSSLLRAALERLSPGGRLVYSTCSVEATENEDVVRGMLSETGGVTLVDETWHRPGQPCDGGYQALISRI